MYLARSLKYLGIALVWLLVWQAASLAVNNDILLCSPLDVLHALANDVITVRFWQTILYTLLRISAGFFLAFIFGVLLGALAWRFGLFATFFDPAVLFVKSVPIVCFIVLLLIWFGSPLISASAVFLVAFPAVYFAVAEGLRAQDGRLLEMLRVFRVSARRRLLVFYWPTILQFLSATSRVEVGMAWKSGVAAELIGLPLGSIGERIYQSKILLSSVDLFAWTLVIVAAALVCEKLFLLALRLSAQAAWRLALPRCPRAARRAESSVVDERLDVGHVQPSAADGRSSIAAEQPDAGRVQPVVISNLRKSFGEKRDARVVISDFSAILKPGGRYVLNSSSGGGKTTLLRLIAGLSVPDSGTIRGVGPLAMVFQEARLFEQRSAVDNLRLIVGRKCDEARIRALLGALLPVESLGQPVAELSGGMRRRVELCRALVANSQLLLLDEPFAGLDDASHVAARAFLLTQLKGRTLLLATHDLEDAKALAAETITP
jgi:NitT/TauT family transport system permease protein